VAGNLLNRLFGRSSPPPEVESALAELEQLARQQPVLAGPVAVFRDILPVLFEDSRRDSIPSLTPENASAKLAAGVPLLRNESLLPESRSLHRRWQRVCAAVRQHQGGDAAPALEQAVRQGKLDPLDLVRDVLAGNADALHARVDALGLDAGLAGTVLRFSLFPVLAKVNTSLAPLREGIRWERGFCPTCGSWPLLGEFRGLEQVRFLRCGLCAAEWEFPRLCCPFCGTEDHEVLGYLHVEGEEGRQRAAACDACRGYVKMVTTLSPLGAAELLVQDVATMHLDLIAAEKGYGPPAAD
jgi:FdhE protein